MSVFSTRSIRDVCDGCSINKSLATQLEFLGHKSATFVQSSAIPAIADPARPDVMIQSPTGSGKTLAYMIPAVNLLLEKEAGSDASSRSSGIKVLVLTPTKELCSQTMQVFGGLVRGFPHVIGTWLSGVDRAKSEKNRIRKGVNLLVATPGRLAYHLKHTEALKLDKLRMIVVDEADRMLDMGFEPQLREIRDLIMSKRASSGSGVSKPEAPIDMDSGMASSAGMAPSAGSAAASIEQVVLVSATLNRSTSIVGNLFLRQSRTKWITDEVVRAAKGKEVSPASVSTETKPSSATELDPNAAPTVQPHVYGGRRLVPESVSLQYLEVDLRARSAALLMTLLHGIHQAKTRRVIVFVNNRHAVDFYKALIGTVNWPRDPSGGRDAARNETGDQSGPSHGHSESRVPSHQQSTRALKRQMFESMTKNKKEENENQDDSRHHSSSKGNNQGASHVYQPKLSSFGDQLPPMFDSVKVYGIHGSMDTASRKMVISEFSKDQSISVLVATDVAARGLDIKAVDLVVQLDVSNNMEDFFHRAGRSGRIGHSGRCVSILPEGTARAYTGLLQEYAKSLECKELAISSLDLSKRSFKDTDIFGFFDSLEDPPKYLANYIVAVVQDEQKSKGEGSSMHNSNGSDDESDSHRERGLSALGLSAYLGTLRAYRALIGKELRQVFNSKRVHTGHLARSFGVSETPSEVFRKSGDMQSDQPASPRDDSRRGGDDSRRGGDDSRRDFRPTQPFRRQFDRRPMGNSARSHSNYQPRPQFNRPASSAHKFSKPINPVKAKYLAQSAESRSEEPSFASKKARLNLTQTEMHKLVVSEFSR